MAKLTNLTTISITKEARDKLQSLMKYGETYDGIIKKLVDEYLMLKRERDNASSQNPQT